MSDMVSVSPKNPEENSTQPPTPPKANKALLAVVIALGVLILVGLGVLIAGILLGGNSQSADSATVTPAAATKPAKPVSMTLAPGYKILSSDTQPGRLILHIRSAAQDEIDVIDLNDGHIISQIHAEAPQ